MFNGGKSFTVLEHTGKLAFQELSVHFNVMYEILLLL